MGFVNGGLFWLQLACGDSDDEEVPTGGSLAAHMRCGEVMS